MRSLDLYTEKQTADGSPDKIAASNAFVREANSLSLASLTPNQKDVKETREPTAHAVNLDAAHGNQVDVARSAHGDKTGLMSLFTDMPDTSKLSSPRDLRDRRAFSSATSFNNPLSLFGLGGFNAREQPMTRQELQILADRSVVHERMQRVIARQAFLLKEKKVKSEKGDKGNKDKFTNVNDTTTISALAASNKTKFSYTKDRVSIANGVKRAERVQQPQKPRDFVKENKLLKKKQMLVDYLEKFRGKLSLQEVSEVISQMEKLDKALLLMAN